MKLFYCEQEFPLEVFYRPEDGRMSIEIVTHHPKNNICTYGGVGRDFNSAFMDLLDNLQVQYMPV